MDYLCAKFDNFSFSRFGFIVWTDRITESQTELEEHSIEVHNSRRPLGRLTLTLTLILTLTFDL